MRPLNMLLIGCTAVNAAIKATELTDRLKATQLLSGDLRAQVEQLAPADGDIVRYPFGRFPV